MNAFLQLQDQDLQSFSTERQHSIRQRVERSLRSAEHLASIIELFGPVLADTLNVMSGGDTLREMEYLSLQESGDDDPFGQPPPGPVPAADLP